MVVSVSSSVEGCLGDDAGDGVDVVVISLVLAAFVLVFVVLGPFRGVLFSG